jgi:hypothetical protein
MQYRLDNSFLAKTCPPAGAAQRRKDIHLRSCVNVVELELNLNLFFKWFINTYSSASYAIGIPMEAALREIFINRSGIANYYGENFS